MTGQGGPQYMETAGVTCVLHSDVSDQELERHKTGVDSGRLVQATASVCFLLSKQSKSCKQSKSTELLPFPTELSAVGVGLDETRRPRRAEIARDRFVIAGDAVGYFWMLERVELALEIDIAIGHVARRRCVRERRPVPHGRSQIVNFWGGAWGGTNEISSARRSCQPVLGVVPVLADGVGRVRP